MKKMFNVGSTGRQILSLGQICKQKGLSNVDHRKFKLSGEKTPDDCILCCDGQVVQWGKALTKPMLPTTSDVP